MKERGVRDKIVLRIMKIRREGFAYVGDSWRITREMWIIDARI